MNENAKQRSLHKMFEIMQKLNDKDTDIRALFISRSNLDLTYKSSNAVYNEMTDRINEYCDDAKKIYDDLAAFANSTLKLNPARHWPSSPPFEAIAPMPPIPTPAPQDSSKMPNPDTMHGAEVSNFGPPTVEPGVYRADTDDIPF